MTREQFEKAEAITSQFDIAQKQLEVTTSIKNRVNSTKDTNTNLRDMYESIADDFKELFLAILLDNNKGVDLLVDVTGLLESRLSNQCASLADEFNNL